MVRACRDIKQHEAILVHYNPGAGIETWKDVFKCGCCQCRGVCRPPAQRMNNVEANFRTSSLQCAIRRKVERREMKPGDFVKTHEGDFWGNVVECVSGDVKVRGFCTSARKLVLKRLNHACVRTQDRMMWWKSASTTICSTALARIWEPQRNSTAKGGWLEDGTVDAEIRWSLYGDTKTRGLAPPHEDWIYSVYDVPRSPSIFEGHEANSKLGRKPVAPNGLGRAHGTTRMSMEGSRE